MLKNEINVNINTIISSTEYSHDRHGKISVCKEALMKKLKM